MKIKVSDYIANFLRIQKTQCVFEVAGGMITHLLDSIYNVGNTNIISIHHEQAGAFAADAYGRYTGRPGIALATSGPGATNLLTGIGSAYFDSSPALFITGQVNTHEQKRNKGIRQLGFQETDIFSISTPITKKSYKICKPEEVEHIFTEAYRLTMSDRPGPVLIDIPMDIQRAMIDVGKISYIERPEQTGDLKKDTVDELIKNIRLSKRPLILVGNGINCSRSLTPFKHFIEKVKIPVVTSLLGLDAIPYEHPLRVGLIGSYGNRWANLAIGSADLLIVIGSRLDIRQTGSHIEGFKKGKTIFHIDCDEQEINNRINDCIPIVAEIKWFLDTINHQLINEHFPDRSEWLLEIAQLKELWPAVKELQGFEGINPNEFMCSLSKKATKYASFVVDVGNHQMWAAQSLELNSDQKFLTSGGMGAMGFALPAAIGFCLASEKRPMIVIVGDGSFQMNIQELQTIIRNKLPIKIIVLNNQCLGMIRQFQDSYFDSRYQSTYWGYSAPDFSAIAKAYSLPAMTITEPSECEDGLSWLCADPLAPQLLQVMISHKMNVYPKIAFGKPITEMEPFAKPTEMEGT